MVKKELIDAVAEKANLSKKDAQAAVTAVFGSIQDSLVRGESVQIVGFGTFAAKQRAQRNAINPITKEKIVVPATVAPVFKAGKGLKEAVSK